MKIEVISVADEFVAGEVCNVGAKFIAKKCFEYGLDVVQMVEIPNQFDVIRYTLDVAVTCADVIILYARSMDIAFCVNQHIYDTLDIFSQDLSKKFDKNKEVYRYVSKNQKSIYILHGNLKELKLKFELYMDYMLEDMGNDPNTYRVVKLFGRTKDEIQHKLNEIAIPEDIQVTVMEGNYDVQVVCKSLADHMFETKHDLKSFIRQLKSLFGQDVYSTEAQDEIEDVVIQLLNKLDLKITTAESCTGGLCASRLINVSGASNVIEEAYVTYSNRIKRDNLGVNKETLRKYTAVSAQTAEEMASGIAKKTGCDCSISITGYAGPEGGDQENPVGTVYIGCCTNETTEVKKYIFQGNRAEVREQAVVFALDLLRRCVVKEYM